MSRNGHDTPWTEERLMLMKRLFIDEGRSAGYTAEKLGPEFTRSAVIGKASRQGWRRSAEVVQSNRTESSRKAARRSGPHPKTKPPTPIRTEARVFAPVAPRHFLTRRLGECSWPVSGEGADLMVCCAPIVPGKLWCAPHCKRGHQKAPAADAAAVGLTGRFRSAA